MDTLMHAPASASASPSFTMRGFAPQTPRARHRELLGEAPLTASLRSQLARARNLRRRACTAFCLLLGNLAEGRFRRSLVEPLFGVVRRIDAQRTVGRAEER